MRFKTLPKSSPRSCLAIGQSGFTLIELLVVLAILTLLAGLVGPRVLSQLGGAKSKTAALQIADIDKSLELFKLDVGRFPTGKEGLDALATAPHATCHPIANGGIEIISLGADAATGGDGENADIRNKP